MRAARLGGALVYVAAAGMGLSLPLEWISARSQQAGLSVSGADFVGGVLAGVIVAALLAIAATAIVFRTSRWACIVAAVLGATAITFALIAVTALSSVAQLVPKLARQDSLANVRVGIGLWVVGLAGLTAVAGGALSLVEANRGPSMAGTAGIVARDRADAAMRRLAGESADRVASSYGATSADVERWRSQFVSGGRRAVRWRR